MIQPIYTPQQLPVQALETLGLMQKGRPAFGRQDLDALLSGRRTSLIRMANLNLGGVPIIEIKAKFSLQPAGPDGPVLLIHPVYNHVNPPAFLTPQEAIELETGKIANIWKVIPQEEGGTQERLVEFDPQTKEYIITDSQRIQVPDLINQQYLSPGQKERFRQGREVELTDGTLVQYAATEAQGIRSSRLALVASLIVDGGLSYILYEGLQALLGKKDASESRKTRSPGYQHALAEAEKQPWSAGSEAISSPASDSRSRTGR